MASLPSYHEATTRVDWTILVAPYIEFSDYRTLCLVNNRFWAVFAPRLWGNLLTAVRRAGLDPSDDLSWWIDFVFNKLGAIRLATRLLVRVLDIRAFAKDAYDLTWGGDDRTFQQSLKHALTLLPGVNCLLLDGHPDIDPGALISSLATTGPSSWTKPLLLSIAGSPYQLPSTFYSGPVLSSLVYLDISNIPGSVYPLIKPALLPDLRILKIRHREVDSATITALASLFQRRLWSLDIGFNKASDDVVDVIAAKCFPAAQLRSSDHFYVEGKLVFGQYGSRYIGPFVTIQESHWSGTFNNPERYLVDSPVYRDPSDTGFHGSQAIRQDGRTPCRQSSADVVSALLSTDDITAEDVRFSQGLTHLDVSNNQISAFGLSRLITTSNGQLEYLACDSLPLVPSSLPYAKVWPKGLSMHGIIGFAHLFRPVVSSNLRTLRIHHSLITHIPELQNEGLSTLARNYLAENDLLPRVDMAYGQVFAPDMNPRLASLTLTCIPRRSSGPLIRRLVSFVRLLAIQESNVQAMDAAQVRSWREPGMLKGLRHLRLEFEPDPMQDGFSTLDDLDAEHLMNSGDRGFSFFETEGSTPTPSSPPSVSMEAKKRSGMRDLGNASPRDAIQSQSVREDQEYITYRGEWNGHLYSIPVWIGKIPSSNKIVDDYRRLVIEQNLHEGVGPVTPAQVLVGAPQDAYIFHATWCMAIMPKHIAPPPLEALAEMKDVLEELKKYRLSSRSKYMHMKQNTAVGSIVPLGDPHFFWTGRLEVYVEDPAARTRPSQYWR